MEGEMVGDTWRRKT